MGEMLLRNGESVKSVNGSPRIWEFVAYLEEKLVGEMERCFGEAGVEFCIRAVLLLVEDCAHSKEVSFINWTYRSWDWWR